MKTRVWQIKTIYRSDGNRHINVNTVIAGDDIEARDKAWKLVTASVPSADRICCESKIICETDD